MKKIKKMISLMLAIIIVATVASISVFADWAGSQGCYKTSYELLINDAELTWNLEVNRISLVSATGVGYHHKPYTYRVAVNAYAYCSDCDLFANNQGYGWMGNPGQSTAYINVDGYDCIEAGAEYIYYQNGVYLATRYMDWDSRDYPN